MLEERLVYKMLCSDSVGTPFVLCPSYDTAIRMHPGDDRKSWLEKRNVSGAPLGSLTSKISPKLKRDEWIWERQGLVCSVKGLLVKTAGKTTERNYFPEGKFSYPSANRGHCFSQRMLDATK